MPLPVPPDTMKVTLRATLSQGNTPVEEAQFGFHGTRVHVAGNETNWPDDVTLIAEKVRDRWVEHITSLGFWSTAVRMDTVRVDHYTAATGRVEDVGLASFTGTGNEWAGTNAASLPWETTLAVSLYGYEQGQFVLNKARKRGRMYLPPPSVLATTTPTGQFGSANLDELHGQVLDFFNDVQGMEFDGAAVPADPDYFDLRIISKGTPEKPLAPTSTPVVRVQIDSRIDSQRRRERQQPPLYVVAGAIERA